MYDWENMIHVFVSNTQDYYVSKQKNNLLLSYRVDQLVTSKNNSEKCQHQIKNRCKN